MSKTAILFSCVSESVLTCQAMQEIDHEHPANYNCRMRVNRYSIVLWQRAWLNRTLGQSRRGALQHSAIDVSAAANSPTSGGIKFMVR